MSELYSIDIVVNSENTIRLYKKFISSEKKKLYRKMLLWPLLAGGILLLIASEIFEIEFLFFFGAIFTTGSLAMLIYYELRFATMLNAIKASVSRAEKSDEKNFTFSFDEEEITRKSSNANVSIQWTYITGFHLEGGEIYLFHNNEIHDIISISIIGPDLFDAFKKILLSKKISPRN